MGLSDDGFPWKVDEKNAGGCPACLFDGDYVVDGDDVVGGDDVVDADDVVDGDDVVDDGDNDQDD